MERDCFAMMDTDADTREESIWKHLHASTVFWIGKQESYVHIRFREGRMKKLLFLLPLMMFAADKHDGIAKEVRHELVMLPYYSVFDNLAYRVDGSKVTLFGQVTRPPLKSDAENVVKRIEGVTSVDNEIEVLPVSPNDYQIRRAVYRAIFSRPNLDRY